MKLLNSIMNLGFEKVAGLSRIVWRKKVKITPIKIEPVNDKPIEYILNDLTTPNLVLVVPTPQIPAKPVFSVCNYRGGGFPKGSVECQAANCLFTVVNTIEFLNKYTDKPIQSWASTPSISVFPRAGKGINAFYDRKNLKFFYFSHEKIGTIYTCDSSEVVSHELGHAILDSYRPDMWNAASLEISAFHESFGDFISIMQALSHDEVCNYVLSQTEGDISKRNIISDLAEHIAKTLFILIGPSDKDPSCLRCAINNFKYVSPGTLPKQNVYSQLAAESHSFSRIFTGALYDILIMIYKDIQSTGASNLDSLKQARDVLLRYVMKAIQFVPLNVNFFEAMSRTILWTDVTLLNWKYHDRIQQIFFDRNLLTPQIRMLSSPTCDNTERIVTIQSTMSIKLSEHLLLAQSNNPLFNVDVEIPHNQAYLYDNDKNLLDSILISENESLSGAQDMLSYLFETNSVGDDPLTPFEIKDGKLIRTHFV